LLADTASTPIFLSVSVAPTTMMTTALLPLPQNARPEALSMGLTASQTIVLFAGLATSSTVPPVSPRKMSQPVPTTCNSMAPTVFQRSDLSATLASLSMAVLASITLTLSADLVLFSTAPAVYPRSLPAVNLVPAGTEASVLLRRTLAVLPV
jgi:hypothetical protein